MLSGHIRSGLLTNTNKKEKKKIMGATYHICFVVSFFLLLVISGGTSSHQCFDHHPGRFPVDHVIDGDTVVLYVEGLPEPLEPRGDTYIH